VHVAEDWFEEAADDATDELTDDASELVGGMQEQLTHV
jgi:hypothetical protein